jgi:hypothetical protein
MLASFVVVENMYQKECQNILNEIWPVNNDIEVKSKFYIIANH